MTRTFSSVKRSIVEAIDAGPLRSILRRNKNEERNEANDGAVDRDAIGIDRRFLRRRRSRISHLGCRPCNFGAKLDANQEGVQESIQEEDVEEIKQQARQ